MEKIRKTLYGIVIALGIATTVTVGSLNKTFAAPTECYEADCWAEVSYTYVYMYITQFGYVYGEGFSYEYIGDGFCRPAPLMTFGCGCQHKEVEYTLPALACTAG